MTEPGTSTDGQPPRAAEDYRTSHVGEGEDYHRKFSEQPYRAIIWGIEQRVLNELVASHVAEPGKARLLDFACGTGRVLALLENRVGRAVGVDVSASMLAVAERQVRGATLHCLDITQEDRLEGERFEIITAFRFFPNAEPELRDAVMAKLSRLLAPGGILIFNNHRRCGSLRHRLHRLLFRLRIKRNRRNLHCMADGEAAALAARHGLIIAERRDFGILPVLNEGRTLLPEPLVRTIEGAAARRSTFASWAGYTIFVLRHKDADGLPCSSS